MGIDEFLKNVSVLFVEDDKITREEFTDFLEFEVGKVYSASNGEEGLELFKKHKPDIVITDIEMPIMNGINMAKMIKSISKSTPIAITSAYNEDVYLSHSKESCIDDYIVKPFDFIQIVDVLKKNLKRINYN